MATCKTKQTNRRKADTNWVEKARYYLGSCSENSWMLGGFDVTLLFLSQTDAGACQMSRPSSIIRSFGSAEFFHILTRTWSGAAKRWIQESHCQRPAFERTLDAPYRLSCSQLMRWKEGDATLGSPPLQQLIRFAYGSKELTLGA